MGLGAENRHINPQTKDQDYHHTADPLTYKGAWTLEMRTCLTKRGTCHAFWHSFATNLPNNAYYMRTVYKFFGHDNIKTTMMYNHALNVGVVVAQSPADGF